jgi:UDP-glucose 4-epimerase
MQSAVDVDVVVHAAALHGIHLEKCTADDFWDLNVAGTRNVYEAALQSGIDKVLLCSTMGVYGEGAREAGDPPVITEDLSLEPSDYYGFSKRVCEEIAAYYHHRHGIRTIAYTLGMFVPESFVGYGFRLLKGGVDDRDVAQAFLLGLDDASVTFDTFDVMAEVPLSTEEFGRCSREPESFLEERYPGVAELVEKQGADFGGRNLCLREGLSHGDLHVVPVGLVGLLVLHRARHVGDESLVVAHTPEQVEAHLHP